MRSNTHRTWAPPFGARAAVLVASSTFVALALSVVSAGPAGAAGTPAKLVFTTEPTPAGVGAGQAFSVGVSIEDADGNVVTTSTDSITLGLNVYAPDSGFSCTGSTTQNAVGGVALFSCSITQSGDYSFVASDNPEPSVSAGISTSLSVAPGTATALSFATQPDNASTNATFPVVVAAVDQYGNVVFGDSTDTVDLALSGGTPGANLSCSPGPSELMSLGEATFSCSVDTPGAGFQIVATTSGSTLSFISSQGFDVGQETAVMIPSASPAASINGVGSFTVALTLEDAGANPIAGHQVEVDLGGVGPGYEVGSGTTNASGVAAVSVSCPSAQPTFQLTGVDDTTATVLPSITATCVDVDFPTQDHVGSVDTLDTLGAQPSSSVSVSFAATPTSTRIAAAMSGTCTTDGGGDLGSGTCTYTVPSVPGVTPPASVTAFVTVGSSSYEVDGFDLLPAIAVQLTPSTGAAGTPVTATATGFQAFETVAFTYGGSVSMGSCVASSIGSCSIGFDAPAGEAGTYSVSASGESSLTQANAPFSLVTALDLSPSVGPASSSFDATANGFLPGESVQFAVGGTPAGSCSAGSNGSCTAQLAAPSGGIGAYVVKATGQTSGIAAATTFTEAGAPGAPTSASAVAGESQATVSWVAPPANDAAITAYTVTASDVTTPSNGGQTCAWSSGALSCTVTSLRAGDTYTFSVTAANVVGSGPSSSPSNPIVPVALPSAPTGVSAVAGDAGATISWNASMDNGSAVASYTVTAVDLTTPRNGGQTCRWSSGPLRCVVRTLIDGDTYRFAVVATNGVGTGPSSASNVVEPAGEPGSPRGIRALTALTGQATVTWSASPANGSTITGYIVAAFQIDGSSRATCTWSSGPLRCTVTGLNPTVPYAFTVVAQNAIGSGLPGVLTYPFYADGATTLSVRALRSIVPVGAQATLLAYGAPPGSTITFSSPTPGGACKADTSGQCTISLAATTAGRYSIRATDGSASASARIDVPSIVVPKTVVHGGAIVVRISHAPSHARIVVTMSDGRTFRAIASSKGRAILHVAVSRAGTIVLTIRISEVALPAYAVRIT